MMTWVIVCVYFVIGGVATAVVNKRKPEGAQERWVKYVTYLIIVFLIMGLIEAGLFVFVAGLVAGIGLYEIVKIGWRKKTTVITGLGLYLLIAFLFIVFAAMADKKYQLLLYTTVLTFDGFSQLSGQLFGKTKLAPKISPGKTIEGLIGGLIFATATAYFIWNEPLQGVIICVAALLGDLLASYYKRKCGVEDYSNLIPGHGGVLDRFDSLIFAGAVCVLIW